jgi:membrane-bound metal-dependent hydrolase YbcI (DUF457 family)
MTFNGHTKITLASIASVFILQPSVLTDASPFAQVMFIAALVVGNYFPDFSEMRIIPHRTYTHYPLFYLMIGGAAWVGLTQPDILSTIIVLEPIYFVVALGFATGALTHIVCDWPFYSGIPLLRPTRRIPLTQFTFDGGLNNSIENVVAFGIVAVSIGLTLH